MLWDCMMLTTEALCFNSEWDTKCEMWQMAALGFGINIFRDITCPYVMPLHSYIQQLPSAWVPSPVCQKKKNDVYGKVHRLGHLPFKWQT